MPGLILSQMEFAMQAIQGNWLKLKGRILHLRIEKSNLATICSGAFESPVFGRLATLELVELPITSLAENPLSGLQFLQTLGLEQLKIESIPSTLLESVPLLATLYVLECDSQLMDVSQMSAGDHLKVLDHIEFFDNSIRSTISAKTFVGMPKLTVLVLKRNKIDGIENGVLKALPKSLEQLDLSSNKLKTIPADLSELLKRAKSLQIFLQNNPWECTCDLENFRQLLNTHLKSIDHQYIRCSTPPKYKSMRITSLSTFCTDITIPPTTTLAAVLEAKPPPKIQINLICKKSKTIVSIEKPSQNIRVERSPDDTYSLIIPEFSQNHYLIGFKSKSSGWTYDELIFDYSNFKRSSCTTNSDSMQTKNFTVTPKLKPNKLYRFCVLQKGFVRSSPLDCISFYTKTGDVKENAWIYKENRTITIILCIVAGVSTLLLGNLLSFSIAKACAMRSCRKVAKQPLTRMGYSNESMRRLKKMYVDSLIFIYMLFVLRSFFFAYLHFQKGIGRISNS